MRKLDCAARGACICLSLRKEFFLFAALAMIPINHAGAETSLLWTGSGEAPDILAGEEGGLAEGRGNLSNRAELKAATLGLSARFLVLDKRPLLFWENREQGFTLLSGGIYHNGSGSRLLYGVLDEWGLSARLKNPWGKAVPFAAARRAMSADLKTEASSSGENKAFLYLGSPRMEVPLQGKLRLFGSVQAAESLSPAFGGGAELSLSKKTALRAEGFYTQKRLAAFSPSTWFSFPPPLPERDFSLSGAGLFFSSPVMDAAFDGAYSETFAWGRGLYGSFALRVGDKPWRVSAAADAAGGRFVDRDGAAAEPGFRTAARFELKGKSAALFSAALILRSQETASQETGDQEFGSQEAASQEIWAPFNRASAELSYRFPSSLKFPLPRGLNFRPGKLSFGAARDSRDPEKIMDSFDAGAGLYLGPLRTAFSAAMNYSSDGAGYDFDSLKGSGQVSYQKNPLTVEAKAAYTGSPSASPVWLASWRLSLRGKAGRLSLKLSSPEFPEKWDLGLSWRLELRSEKR
ncbi:MAG: hypothetical protein LBU18_00325 [Treponema sp.]|jgi:hypothetical protein|nr:hypothetical protein [Treponema sp.]